MQSQPAPTALAAAPAPSNAGGRPAAAPAVPIPKRWLSQTLFGADREVEIEHAGQLYRLRQTSLGKLILTK